MAIIGESPMFVKPIPYTESYEERLITFTTRRGLIYIIQNIVNGRCYVGQTTQTFMKRYRDIGLWWETTTNKALLADLAIYGAGMFRLRIMEHSKTQKELNHLEPLYAARFNAYLPHGYNKQRCGVIRVRRRPLAQFGPVTLNDPSGKDVVVTDVAALLESHHLNPSMLRQLIEGKIRYHKGWTPAGETNKTDPRKRQCTLYDAAGNAYDLKDGIKAFCDARGLDAHLMACMVNGATYTYGGFALTPNAFAKRKTRWVVTLTREGQDVTIDDITHAKGVIDIHPSYIYRLANGSKASHKGWTLKHVDRVPTRH